MTGLTDEQVNERIEQGKVNADENPNTRTIKVIRIGMKYRTFQVTGTLHTIIMATMIRREIHILKPLTPILTKRRMNLGIYTLDTIGLLALITLTLWRRLLLKKSHKVIPIKTKIAKYCSLDLNTYPNMNT